MLDLFAFAAAAALNRAAASDLRQQSETVPYADLDLASLAGRTTLDHRVHSAANRICRDLAAGQLLPRAAEWDCRSTAIADAGVQVAAASGRAEQRILLARR